MQSWGCVLMPRPRGLNTLSWSYLSCLCRVSRMGVACSLMEEVISFPCCVQFLFWSSLCALHPQVITGQTFRYETGKWHSRNYLCIAAIAVEVRVEIRLSMPRHHKLGKCHFRTNLVRASGLHGKSYSFPTGAPEPPLGPFHSCLASVLWHCMFPTSATCEWTWPC